MATRSTYKPQSLSSKAVNKRSLTVSQFLGVDYNPSQIAVDKMHAVDMKNIIWKDKVNQKRNGYEQLVHFGAETYEEEGATNFNTLNVNGVWNFVAEDGNEYVVAHIGRLLYNITGIGSDKSFLEFHWERITGIPLLADRKSSAFVGTKRLYILDGEKYRVLRHTVSGFSLVNVEDDEDTYVPTTTVGITCIDNNLNQITALDDVNLMTHWKKNKLVSGIGKTVTELTTTNYEWELDSPIVLKTDEDIKKIKVTVDTVREAS